jgi:hypothetical protein
VGKKAMNQPFSGGKNLPREEPEIMDGIPGFGGIFIRIIPGIAVVEFGEGKKDIRDIFYPKNGFG